MSEEYTRFIDEVVASLKFHGITHKEFAGKLFRLMRGKHFKKISESDEGCINRWLRKEVEAKGGVVIAMKTLVDQLKIKKI